MDNVAEAKQVNISERIEAFMARRELSKAQRIVSKQKRLSVDMDGFKTHYEHI